MLEENRENEVNLEHISWYSDINPSQISTLHSEIFTKINICQRGAKLSKQLPTNRPVIVEQLLSLDDTNRF